MEIFVLLFHCLKDIQAAFMDKELFFPPTISVYESSNCSGMQFQLGFPKQAGDAHECTSGNKSKSLDEGEGFVALLGCALFKASLSSERASPGDTSEWERQ